MSTPVPLAVVLSMTDAYAKLAVTYKIGRVELLHTGTMDDFVHPETVDEFERTVIRDWVEHCGYEPGSPAGQIVRGLLYAGISWYVHRGLPPPPTPGGGGEPQPWDRIHLRYWAGTKAQHLLLQGLRHAEPDERQRVHDDLRTLDATHVYATNHFTGALAAARADEALRNTDLVLGVRSATLYEDTRRSTDFVVTSHWPGGGGCLAQVKTAGPGCGGVYLANLAQRPSYRGLLPKGSRAETDLADAIRIWEEAYLRGLQENQRWYGLLIYVDVQAIPAAELLDPALRDRLRDCLRETGLFDASNAPTSKDKGPKTA